MTSPATSSTDMPCTCTPIGQCACCARGPEWDATTSLLACSARFKQTFADRHAIHGEEDVAGRDAAARVQGRAFGKGLHDARRHVTMPCTPAPQILSAADPQLSLIPAGHGVPRIRRRTTRMRASTDLPEPRARGPRPRGPRPWRRGRLLAGQPQCPCTTSRPQPVPRRCSTSNLTTTQRFLGPVTAHQNHRN
jgi:hypothetical protein